MDRRQSERVHVKLRVGVRGADAAGAEFVEQTQTVHVNRGGALIRLARQLAPGAKLVLTRPDVTGKPVEAAARVVERLGSDANGCSYSVAFEEPGANLWGIAFPDPRESQGGIARLLLECIRCGSHEVACLDERQLEDLESMRTVARACRACVAPTLWKHAPEEISELFPPPASPETGEVIRPRKKRISSRVNACIRRPGFADEIAVCENLSAGGLCFRSRRPFPQGERVDVALPYIKGASNIFVPAKIVHVSKVFAAGIFRHGAEYITADDLASDGPREEQD